MTALVAGSDLYRRYVGFSCRRPQRVALLLGLLCLPAAGLTGKFFAEIEAGLQELLPPESPSVRALTRIHDRLGSQAHLTVIADSPDPAANRRFIDALALRLHALRLPEARSIQADVRALRAWFRARAPLLLPAETFDALLGDIEAAVAAARAEANPLFVGLDDQAEASPPRWQGLRTRLAAETAAHDRFPTGYLETPDGRTVVMLIWLQGSEVDRGPSARLLAAVEREAAALRPGFPRVLRVAYTGDVANLIEEHDAILADLSLSSVLVFVLVSALIIVYFRSLRSVVVVLAGLLPGLLFTFAIGRFAIGHLNSSTAFLGSIIAGNGINYPLLFLAYYRTRPAGEPMAEAVHAAARAAMPGTLGAAATASAAYAGLAVSNFRGFSQFGWLGGIGMITTWALTFVTLPAAIAWLSPPRRAVESRAGRGWLAAFLARRWLASATALAFVALSLIVGGLGVARGTRDGIYEMHLLALRNRESLRSGSASWEGRMSELFGSWVNPVVVMVPEAATRTEAAGRLRSLLTDGVPAALDRVETIDTYRPPVPEQERRLVRLRKLARTLGQMPPDAVPADARVLIDEWLVPERLRPLTEAEIPALVTQGFREISGATDRTIHLYPSVKIDYADGVNMQALASKLSQIQLPEGAVVGGAFLFMADVIRLVRDEAPRVVLVVALLVVAVLVPFFYRRPRRIGVVILTVAPVALCAQAIMLAVGVRINMLNFAAVPITIGVGADYALNLLGAMDSLRVGAREACARMGGAILLCSLTTIVGYASLLVAQSGALRTFGWAAVLGEVMAVLGVLLVLPALLPGNAAGELKLKSAPPSPVARPVAGPSPRGR